MRIAIPTNDKIVVSNNPAESEFFKVVTFRGEELMNEEFRPNPIKGGNHDSRITMSEANRLVYYLADCDVIICHTESSSFYSSPVKNLIKTVVTKESLITKAALNYNGEYLQHERNSCCSP